MASSSKPSQVNIVHLLMFANGKCGSYQDCVQLAKTNRNYTNAQKLWIRIKDDLGIDKKTKPVFPGFAKVTMDIKVIHCS